MERGERGRGERRPAAPGRFHVAEVEVLSLLVPVSSSSCILAPSFSLPSPGISDTWGIFRRVSNFTEQPVENIRTCCMCFLKCLDFRSLFINKDHFLLWSTLETRSREAVSNIIVVSLYFLVTPEVFPSPPKILPSVFIAEILASWRQNGAGVGWQSCCQPSVGRRALLSQRPAPEGCGRGRQMQLSGPSASCPAPTLFSGFRG